jgi:RimJ/RimL family protein N-acetyltransferase
VILVLPEHLQTERLTLRAWTEADLDPLAEVFSAEAVWQFPLGRGLTREETAAFLQRQRESWRTRGFGLWAAELRGTAELIGFIGLSVPLFLPEVLPAVEVGWRIHPRHWEQGLATEGGRVSIVHGFASLGLDRIVSIAEPANEASIRVMRKLGMTEAHRTTHPDLGIPLSVHEIIRPAVTEANLRAP